MRIAVGGLLHESNTFTNLKTSFEDFNIIEGKNFFKENALLEDSSIGGIVNVLKERNIEIIPTLYGEALPSGIIKKEVYDYLSEKIINKLSNIKELDGICLALHGSMYVSGLEDPEGDLLEKLRKVVGENVLIVAALDLHANMTKKMIKNADAFTVYKTAPHTDKFLTGVNAAELLLNSLYENKKLAMFWKRIPILLSGEQSETNVNPMQELISNLHEKEEEEHILSASYLIGFAWADSYYTGAGVLTVGYTKNYSLIEKENKILAECFWKKRFDFEYTTPAYTLKNALNKAYQEEGQPVVIADTGDNPTAGAAEDTLFALKAVLEKNLKNILLAVIVDESSVKKSIECGKGSKVELKIGKSNLNNQEYLEVIAEVINLKTVDEINCSVIKIKDIIVILADKRTDVYDPQFLVELELNPKSFKIIIVKSGYLSPEYSQIAYKSLFALTPGDTNLILSELPYKKLKRPIFPFDKNINYEYDK